MGRWTSPSITRPIIRAYGRERVTRRCRNARTARRKWRFGSGLLHTPRGRSGPSAVTSYRAWQGALRSVPPAAVGWSHLDSVGRFRPSFLDRSAAITGLLRRRSGRFRGSLVRRSVGFATFVLNGLFSRFGGRRACTAGRIRGERIDSVLRLLRALLRYGLERASVCLVRGSRTHLVPGRSKAIEPSPLVDWGAGVRLVLHVDSPPVVPRVCSLMFLTNVWPYKTA